MIYKCKKCKCTFEIKILSFVETVTLSDTTEDVTIPSINEEIQFGVCASCGYHDLVEQEGISI